MIRTKIKSYLTRVEFAYKRSQEFIQHTRSFFEKKQPSLSFEEAKHTLIGPALQMWTKGILSQSDLIRLDTARTATVPMDMIQKILEFKNSPEYDPDFELKWPEVPPVTSHNRVGISPHNEIKLSITGAPSLRKGSKAVQQLMCSTNGVPKIAPTVYRGYPVRGSGVNEEERVLQDLRNAESVLDVARSRFIGWHLVKFFERLNDYDARRRAEEQRESIRAKARKFDS